MGGLGSTQIKNISHFSEELWYLFPSWFVPTQNNQPRKGTEGYRDLKGKKKFAESCSQGLLNPVWISISLLFSESSLGGTGIIPGFPLGALQPLQCP